MNRIIDSVEFIVAATVHATIESNKMESNEGEENSRETEKNKSKMNQTTNERNEAMDKK